MKLHLCPEYINNYKFFPDISIRDMFSVKSAKASDTTKRRFFILIKAVSILT